jgi:hypothetical protein
LYLISTSKFLYSLIFLFFTSFIFLVKFDLHFFKHLFICFGDVSGFSSIKFLISEFFCFFFKVEVCDKNFLLPSLNVFFLFQEFSKIIGTTEEELFDLKKISVFLILFFFLQIPKTFDMLFLSKISSVSLNY